MADDIPTILRCSALNYWPDCPRRSAANLFWRDIKDAGYSLRQTVTGIAAHVGSAVHAGARQLLAHKAKTGELSAITEAADAAVYVLEERTSDEGAIYDDDTKHLDDARYQVRRMVSTYLPVARKIDPIMVEERLEATVSPGVILSGQPDNVARSPHAIHDLKTGKSMPNARPQVGAYALVARSHNLSIERGFIDYVPRVSTRKPQPPAVSAELDLAGCESTAMTIVHHIVDDLKVFREGNPARHIVRGDPAAFMANPNSMLCSEKYCRAWGTAFCQEGRMK